MDYDAGAFHAALDYNAIKSAGPAARPMEFPAPTVLRGNRVTVKALDHRTNKVHMTKNVLIAAPSKRDGGEPNEAFLIRKKISRSVYGAVRICVVLKRRTREEKSRRKRTEDVDWVSTEHLVAVKISAWANIRHTRGRHLEDPIKEISAMQLVGDYHPHVCGTIAVMQDDDYLYTIERYCSGGDLFGKLMTAPAHSVDEASARLYFRQILSGLFHLQRKGVCHRDLSLENLLLDENGNLVMVDLGLALRVPYTDPCNENEVTDVSEGTERRLMVAQGQGGKLMYMAPEIITRQEAFDGFATDLWSAAVILFALLVGLAPFKWANESDKRFSKIAGGNLAELLDGLNVSVSHEACDLLQNMLWQDPRKRLTLAQVMNHPWVSGKKVRIAPAPQCTTVTPVHSPPRLQRVTSQ